MINEGNEPENFFWVGLGERLPYDTVSKENFVRKFIMEFDEL